ncbi:MAG: hypothetical protein NDJ90_00645, partial [Oligoflexia bacterium]|nr:hypothetical protein [Oligoflexia bacterium]
MRNYREEIRVGLAIAAVAFFFSHGLPLWDDDYGIWLAQAGAGFFEVLLRILSPLTSEPHGWGYSDRPVQVLLYQLLHGIFGYWGTGYFFVKSVAFGALGGALFHAMKRHGVERGVAYLALALFALSGTSVATLVWHSDFAIYSQLVMVLLLLWSFPVLAAPQGRRDPVAFARFSILFFLAVYVGTKIKGEVRLLPLILLVWLYLFRKENFKRYVWPLSASFLATLPWSLELFKSRPPFIPGATGYQGWTYAPFSPGRVVDFLLGDVLSFQRAPLSVLGAVGGLLVIAALGYGAYRGLARLRPELFARRTRASVRGETPVPAEDWALLGIWLAAMLLACGLLAPQSHAFQLRYTVMPLVPATILLALIGQSAIREFAKVRWLKPALMVLVAAQCGVHLYHGFQYRRDMGRMTTAIDQLYRAVEERYAGSTLALAPGFLPYAYKPGQKPFDSRRTLASLDELGQGPAGQTMVASWNAPLDSRFTVEAVATGCGSSLFDLLLRCRSHEGALLLRHLGPVREVLEADQLDKQGNLAAARQVLEAYVRKVPGNLGAGFVLSLYAYRQGDYALMERLYEQFGPFFPSHPSVLYNWGLAKLGLKKLEEATALLEKAYALVPNDYAIGFNLGEVYHKRGLKKKARAVLEGL